MASTYEPIATTTLSNGTTSSVTFSSISGSFTDLVIVSNLGSASAYYPSARFNSDSGANYSVTNLSGDGTGTTSDRGTARTVADLSYEVTLGTGVTSNYISHIMNYSNSTTYKTVLTRMNNAGIAVSATVSLWRSTSAITSITLYSSAGNGALTANFASGSTFTLYGIKAA